MTKLCAEPSCINPVPTEGRATEYCSRACKDRFHSREMSRGAQIMRLARLWRQDGRRDHRKGTKVPTVELMIHERPKVLRGLGELPKGRFGLLSLAIDEFIREDREMREAALLRCRAA